MVAALAQVGGFGEHLPFGAQGRAIGADGVDSGGDFAANEPLLFDCMQVSKIGERVRTESRNMHETRQLTSRRQPRFVAASVTAGARMTVGRFGRTTSQVCETTTQCVVPSGTAESADEHPAGRATTSPWRSLSKNALSVIVCE